MTWKEIRDESSFTASIADTSNVHEQLALVLEEHESLALTVSQLEERNMKLEGLILNLAREKWETENNAFEMFTKSIRLLEKVCNKSLPISTAEQEYKRLLRTALDSQFQRLERAQKRNYTLKSDAEKLDELHSVCFTQDLN
ncbi:sporulation specific protein Spo2 [Schizosaccharomyces japonicus yFS275]|uniref:Sporulation specific protein Spo2 n=1 Tax=Schizosaccharomyces japonicus (strain yFS275 / FY16936) TaxID=402676 RepID=B6JY25_SCHJY|nr:sporulation specific protein Spo2 [Schizosaccharomyces japonicus yFS275]EEB06443.1 sporulation specific protein Spo2 [Schizosaccharomyces japonicus yFS275]